MLLPKLKNLFVIETCMGIFFQFATNSCKLEPKPINEKSIDGVLRSQTRGGTMIGQMNPLGYGGTP